MMQNNESNSFARFWKTKGYYMLLALCLVAVGVSAWLFVSGAMKEKQAVEESLSVPVTVEDPAAQQSAQSAGQPADAQSEAQAASGEAADSAEATAPVDRIVEDAVMPVSGTVVQDYAMDHLTYNATTQDWRVHNGVDLAAPLGQEVRAAKSGTVSAVFEDEYYGYTVVVQHEGGYASHYCNLEEVPTVVAGDTVTAGQVLGTVGSTALIEAAEEPHLHFEVYLNGESVNPAGFLY